MRVDDAAMTSVHEVTLRLRPLSFGRTSSGRDKEQFLKHVNEGRTGKDLELDEEWAWDNVDDKELDVTKVRRRRRSVT